VNNRYRRNGRLRANDFGGDGPVAVVEILRGELSRVIVEHSGADVDYRFDDHIVVDGRRGRWLSAQCLAHCVGIRTATTFCAGS
jgi:hypothetical protein